MVWYINLQDCHHWFTWVPNEKATEHNNVFTISSSDQVIIYLFLNIRLDLKVAYTYLYIQLLKK